MWKGKVWIKGKRYPIEAKTSPSARRSAATQYLKEHPEETDNKTVLIANSHLEMDPELDGRRKYE